MNMDVIFPIFFAGIAGFIVLQIIKNGGFKGALYGGKIEKEYDPVDAESQGIVRSTLNIKVVSKGSGKRIGVGMTHKSFGGFQSNAVQLDKQNAQKLIKTLEEAIRHI